MFVQCIFRFIQYQWLVFGVGLYTRMAPSLCGWLKRLYFVSGQSRDCSALSTDWCHRFGDRRSISSHEGVVGVSGPAQWGTALC